MFLVVRSKPGDRRISSCVTLEVGKRKRQIQCVLDTFCYVVSHEDVVNSVLSMSFVIMVVEMLMQAHQARATQDPVFCLPKKIPCPNPLHNVPKDMQTRFHTAIPLPPLSCHIACRLLNPSLTRRSRSCTRKGFTMNPCMPALFALSAAPSVASAVTARMVGGSTLGDTLGDTLGKRDGGAPSSMA